MSLKTPDWVKNAVFYQIFPDRFRRSGRADLPAGLNFKPWGSPPEEQGFQGGDLFGVADSLDYLADLGITAIYLCPIFSSAANHRYHTFDYFQVDPLLGGEAGLRELLDRAHQRGMRVVLDGVFNHASRGFWPFHHILENGGNSPYLDWFIIRDWPLRPYSSNKHNPPNYDCWWNLPALPKLNVDNPDVQDYILKVARHWIDFGIDGWRLDVPEEIDNPDFWRRFRNPVKAGNPEAYICGEIWRIAPEWLEGDRFDALMNYPFGEAGLCFLGGKKLRAEYQHGEFYKLEPIDAAGLRQRLDRLTRAYSWEAICAQLNLFDSHDTARIHWMLGEDREALRLAVYYQMTMPGAPCVYYGDEIGLRGAHEPFSREAFPWESRESWDEDVLKLYQEAIRLRHEHPVLRTGSLQILHATGHTFVFLRRLEDTSMVVAFNAAYQPAEVSVDGVPARGQWQNLTGSGEARAAGEKITLSMPARSVMILK
ncbi:MAG TPA: glycoside hydrolase family 13 protein [Calditrichia bacterium]|nr:glycoside hydrolase family 13 protein [Calditrichia bacterium]